MLSQTCHQKGKGVDLNQPYDALFYMYYTNKVISATNTITQRIRNNFERSVGCQLECPQTAIRLDFSNYNVWLRITDEGSVPEMRIWFIL